MALNPHVPELHDLTNRAPELRWPSWQWGAAIWSGVVTVAVGDALSFGALGVTWPSQHVVLAVVLTMCWVVIGPPLWWSLRAAMTVWRRTLRYSSVRLEALTLAAAQEASHAVIRTLAGRSGVAHHVGLVEYNVEQGSLHVIVEKTVGVDLPIGTDLHLVSVYEDGSAKYLGQCKILTVSAAHYTAKVVHETDAMWRSYVLRQNGVIHVNPGLTAYWIGEEQQHEQ